MATAFENNTTLISLHFAAAVLLLGFLYFLHPSLFRDFLSFILELYEFQV